MYVREVPVEYREEIKSIMQNMQTMPAYKDIERLFYVYYRYIKVLQRGENAEKRMKKDLSCPSCKGKVIYYFKNIVSEW